MVQRQLWPGHPKEDKCHSQQWSRDHGKEKGERVRQHDGNIRVTHIYASTPEGTEARPRETTGPCPRSAGQTFPGTGIWNRRSPIRVKQQRGRVQRQQDITPPSMDGARRGVYNHGTTCWYLMGPVDSPPASRLAGSKPLSLHLSQIMSRSGPRSSQRSWTTKVSGRFWTSRGQVLLGGLGPSTTHP